MSEKLPPRGEPAGGFKKYRDCSPCSSVMCFRPDCGNCDSVLENQRKHLTEEALTAMLFYQEISKILYKSKSVPGRIKGIHSFFDPTINANASSWDWDGIKKEVAGLVAKFWDVGTKY